MTEKNFAKKLEELNNLKQLIIDSVKSYNALNKELAGNNILAVIMAEHDSVDDNEYDRDLNYSYLIRQNMKINGQELWFPSSLNC